MPGMEEIVEDFEPAIYCFLVDQELPVGLQHWSESDFSKSAIVMA